MARPLLPPPPALRLSRGRPLRVPPLFLSSPSQQASSPARFRLSSLSSAVSFAVLPCLSIFFLKQLPKTYRSGGRAGQGRAVRGRVWARSATDVFLIRFLICGQSNCNWFVIVSRLRCETSGDFFCIVCPDRGIPSLPHSPLCTIPLARALLLW